MIFTNFILILKKKYLANSDPSKVGELGMYEDPKVKNVFFSPSETMFLRIFIETNGSYRNKNKNGGKLLIKNFRLI